MNDYIIPGGMLKEMLESNDIPLSKRIQVAEEQIEFCNNRAAIIQEKYLNKFYDQRDEEEV